VRIDVMRELDELCPSRRAVFQGLAGAVLLPGVLVACSSDDSGSGSTTDAGDGGESTGGSTVPVSEVPAGTARVVDVDGTTVVVAQPADGQFVAFSAACTHQGTTVAAGDDLTLTCPSHGSRFDASDGSVVNGPATAALASVPVTVDGGSLVFAL
jgi:Rieske Fe-S protein